MRAAIAITANDLKRRLRDRTVLLQGILSPIVFAAIIGVAFSGVSNFRARIGLADADGSDLSRQLVEAMRSEVAPGSAVEVVPVPPEMADAQIVSGALDAAIILPPGFGGTVAGAEPLPLAVVTDAGQRISGDVARSIASGIAARINAKRLAVASALAADSQTPTADRLKQIVEAAAHVRADAEIERREIAGRYSPVAYFGASMAMLFLFFTSGSGARSLIAERASGTLARIRAAPVSDKAILVGKTTSVFLVGLMCLVVVWAVTSLVFDADWGDPVAVIAVIVGVVVATTGISMLVTALARTDAQADGVTSILAFASALLGGSFVSPGGLPELFQSLQLITPNGWALRAFVQIGAARDGVIDVLFPVGVLMAFGFLTGAIALGGLHSKVAA